MFKILKYGNSVFEETQFCLIFGKCLNIIKTLVPEFEDIPNVINTDE